MRLTGREKIYTDEDHIGRDNLVDVLNKATYIHNRNVKQMEFLDRYERGIQPLPRQKTIRPEINIEIEDNVANYVTEFKVGYLWSSPALLVQHGNKDSHKTDEERDDAGISGLNESLRNGSMIAAKDQELARWVEICGIGHRFVDIKTDFSEESDAIVDIFTLDSRNAFCVYYNSMGRRKALGVTYRTSKGKTHYACYTNDVRYDVVDGEIVSETRNILGMIPIVEYERSVDRTGCFERQVSDMNGLNVLVSDFANDLAQRTQEIWWGNDIKFPKVNGKTEPPKSGQWILTFTGQNGTNPKIQPLSSNVDANGILSAAQARWNRILQKCKVPMQHESEGGGSTGVAMDMSTGWSSAEIDAQREQQLIEKGKREELQLILKAISFLPAKVLSLDDPIRDVHNTDVDFHFNRRKNYDMAVKANAFATWVAHGVHGRHALKAVDAFEDTEQVWLDSKETIEQFQEVKFSKNTATDTNERLMSDNSDQAGNSPLIDGDIHDDNRTVI